MTLNLDKDMYMKLLNESIKYECSIEDLMEDKLNKMINSRFEDNIENNIGIDINENQEKILSILKETKFITPDILSSVYEKNLTFDENNQNLLSLSNIFGGPLNKTTYCVVNRKYVYTDENLFLDKETLDFFNKASYIICKLNDYDKKYRVVDIKTEIKYRNNNTYSVIKLTIFSNFTFKYINLVKDEESFNFYKHGSKDIFLNVKKVGEILKKSECILVGTFKNKITGLSEEALLTQKKDIEMEDDTSEYLF